MSLVQIRPKNEKREPPRFLPTTRAEMEARGWPELDILIITGDAYVDHPAFGPILIARFLEGRGYRVGDRGQGSCLGGDEWPCCGESICARHTKHQSFQE